LRFADSAISGVAKITDSFVALQVSSLRRTGVRLIPRPSRFADSAILA
jgi:uncharacterized protein (UPF0210 family)